MITYLTQLTICWTILFLVYYLFLKRETFFRYNRWFLLGGLILGLVIPLIDWTALISHEVESIGHIYIAPVQTQVHQLDVYVATTDHTPLWYLILTGIYSLGVAIVAVKLIKAVFEILSLKKGAEISKEDGYQLILTNQIHMPFSFMNAVYWSRELYHESSEKERILAHEARHVSALHSLDILFIELLCILFWFHPMIYIYRKEIKEVHEYEADAAACVIGSKRAYGQLLLKQANSGLQLALANHFFYSQLKNRFKMMTRKPSTRTAKLKYLIAIPIIGLATLVFSFVNKDILPTGHAIVQTDTFPPNEDQINMKLLREYTGKSGQPPIRKMVGKFNPIKSTGNKPLIELRYSRLNTSGETKNDKEVAVVHFSLENNGTFSDAKLMTSPDSKMGREAIGVVQMTETIQGPRITRLRQGKEVSFRYAFTEGNWLGEERHITITSRYPDHNYFDILSKSMDKTFVLIDEKTMGVMDTKEIYNLIPYKEMYSVSNIKAEEVRKKYKIKKDMLLMDIKSKTWADNHPDQAPRGFKTVVGKVVDMEGKPIAGANVVIKGTRTGTATDFNGEYRLMGVDKNDELVFTSRQGQYEQVIPVGSQTLNNSIVQFPTVTLGTAPMDVVEVYQGNVVEALPRFPGCEDLNGSINDKVQCAEKKFLEYLYENIGYPAIARKNNIQGQVIATFTVKKNGTIDNVHIIKDPGAELGDEVERLLENMNGQGKWTPAMKDGEPVNFKMTIPVIFKLKGENITTKIEKVNMDKTVNPLSEIVVVALSETASQPRKTEQDLQPKNPPNSLDEVVVVGYGERTSKVKGKVEAENKKKGVKTENPLSEKVVIGHSEKSSKLKIRTIEDVDYLIVLDGSIMGHTNGQEILDQIDPTTIESISILKEKNALQMYGNQGKNGVIEITTKMPVMTEKSMRLNLANFKLFPNPVSNELTVHFQGPSGDYELEVANTKGTMLVKKDIYNHDQSKVTMNISNLNTGLYYLRITSNQKITAKAFVKE